MNPNNNNIPSDSLDGVMIGGGSVGAGFNFGIKDSRFDDSSIASNLMFNTNQVISSSNANISPPKEIGIGRMLTTLHLEWRKHETEKCRWSAEKAEYEAKIAIMEGRIKSYSNVNNELLQRIKMLESALLVARSQEKFGKDSTTSDSNPISDYQPPKLIYTQEQSKRGRYLLQQYLKEIQTIDEVLHSKEENDNKIVNYLLHTSGEPVSLPNTSKSFLKSGYDSTNYSKTFGHLDPKKSQSASKPLSVEETSKFLKDMKRCLKQNTNERQLSSSSKSNDHDTSSESKNEPSFNSSYNLNVGLKSSNESHLFDILNSFGSYTSNIVSNDADAEDSIDILNLGDSLETSDSPTHNQLSSMGLSPGISSAVAASGGGVVRKKTNNKKSSRMKMDMFNYNEDDLSGTSYISKKSSPSPIANIFAKPDDSTDNNSDLNAAFESKLDSLAKRFNIGGISDTSTAESDDSSSNMTSSADVVSLSQEDNEIDLGILNDIDTLISSQEDSSILLNASNDEISTDLKSAAIQKHWSINGVLRGHNDSISCVDLHPSDKIAASSSFDGVVNLWFYNDKQKSDMYPTHYLRGHEYPVLYCQFNNIGDCLFTSDCHGNILVWNVIDNGSLMCEYKAHEEAIWHLDHSHLTNTLLSASADGVLSLWKPDSTNAIDTLVITNKEGMNQTGVISADFSPLDSSKIVVSAADAITLYDVNSRKNVFELRLDDKYIPTLSSSSGLIQSSSIHPSMNIYATGWGHNQVKIVDLISGQFVKDFIAHPAPITALSFGNNCSGTFLATAGANGSLHMWNNNYSCYQDVPPHRVKHHSGVNSLRFHSTHPHMVTGGADELVKLYI